MSNKVPNGWKQCKLGEVATIKTGQTNSVDAVADGVYPLFDRSKDVKRSSKYLFDCEAVIVPGEGKDFVPRYYKGKFDLHQRAYAVIPNEQVCDGRYCYYALLDGRSYFSLVAVGSTVMSLRLSTFESFDILLPPLPEQRAIASVLSSLDDKIDLLHRENKTLEAMAETLFRQWFIEEAKDDWEHTKLGEVVTITYGKNLPIKKLLRSGYPVFGGNGQIGFYNKYLYVEPQVLVSCRGEASGKVNISLPRSFITNNSLILVRDKRKEITFEYLKYHSLNYDFTLHVSGSAQPQITIDSLYDAAFLIPPVDLINKFTEIVRGYEEKRTNNLKQIHTLEKLRDTLLPKLMSGEVRVKYEEEEMASCRA